jgi:predicted metal-dependent enzyme (double-stranded beta helix superfamily)
MILDEIIRRKFNIHLHIDEAFARNVHTILIASKISNLIYNYIYALLLSISEEREVVSTLNVPSKPNVYQSYSLREVSRDNFTIQPIQFMPHTTV